MATYYDGDRVSKIREIMPRFNAHARVGDRIDFGLRGDPFWPGDFDSARPSGTITKVKNVGTENATIRVRTDLGGVVDIPAHNIDPRRVWEYDDQTFQRVLSRTTPVEPVGPTSVSYRSSSARNDGLDDLRHKVEQLADRFDREYRDSRSFNGALIASFNELAGEVQKTGETATPFASTFTKEYRSMMDTGAVPKKQPVFDSDFSDSDDDFPMR